MTSGPPVSDDEGSVPPGVELGADETAAVAWPDALEATGEDDVDDALAALGDLPNRPLQEHVAVLDGVHSRLREHLEDSEHVEADPDDAWGADA